MNQRVSVDSDRFSRLLVDGMRSPGDVSWFIGPHGFLHICRAAVGGNDAVALADPRLAMLLDDLDDHATAFDGPPPSDRAKVMLSCARSLIAGDPIEADRASGTLTGDLAALLSGQQPDALHAIVVPIVVSLHAHGQQALLSIIDYGLPGRGLDLGLAPFQRVDSDFEVAVETAARASGYAGDFRYAVLSQRTHIPLHVVGGPSVGLGAAVALRRLDGAQLAPPIDPEWVFTGPIGGDGKVGSLCDSQRGDEYRQKVTALAGRTLVYPAVDSAVVSAHAEALNEPPRLIAVTSLAETEGLIARHLDGRAAYNRALRDAPTIPSTTLARSRSALPWVVAGFVAVLASIGALWLGNQRSQDDLSDQQRRRAAGASKAVTVPTGAGLTDAPFRIDAAEVSNAQFQLCIDGGACRQPSGDEARQIADPANAGFPVTGVEASDGETFCLWAHDGDGSLPTFEQWSDAVRFAAPEEWPYGDEARADLVEAVDNGLPTEIQPVISGAVAEASVAHLAGNVAEWTRTSCHTASSECTEVASLSETSGIGLRIVGVPYSLAREPFGGADWWLRERHDDYVINSEFASRDLGFRCVEDV